jgi:hypothetical protein
MAASTEGTRADCGPPVNPGGVGLIARDTQSSLARQPAPSPSE